MKDKIKCLYSKCENEFTPKNTKTKFCCASHRVMWHRENGKIEEIVEENNRPKNKKRIEKSRNTVADRSKFSNQMDISDMEAEFQELLNSKKDGK